MDTVGTCVLGETSPELGSPRPPYGWDCVVPGLGLGCCMGQCRGPKGPPLAPSFISGARLCRKSLLCAEHTIAKYVS